jgi:hypothetical protein
MPCPSPGSPLMPPGRLRSDSEPSCEAWRAFCSIPGTGRAAMETAAVPTHYSPTAGCGRFRTTTSSARRRGRRRRLRSRRATRFGLSVGNWLSRNCSSSRSRKDKASDAGSAPALMRSAQRPCRLPIMRLQGTHPGLGRPHAAGARRETRGRIPVDVSATSRR